MQSTTRAYIAHRTPVYLGSASIFPGPTAISCSTWKGWWWLKGDSLRPVGSDNDIRTYRWAALVLRAGMYSSFAAMGGGLLWWLLTGAQGGSEAAQKSLPLDAILSELLAGNPLALLNLGVL